VQCVVAVGVQAAKFQRQGTQLRKKMWWQNFRMQVIVVGVVVLLAVVIFLLACFTGGKNCISKGGGGGNGAPAPAPAPGSPWEPGNSNYSPGEPMPGQTGPAAPGKR